MKQINTLIAATFAAVVTVLAFGASPASAKDPVKPVTSCCVMPCCVPGAACCQPGAPCCGAFCCGSGSCGVSAIKAKKPATRAIKPAAKTDKIPVTGKVIAMAAVRP